MNQNQQEIEAKFFIKDLGKLQELLVRSGARCVQERVFEINLRFDKPDRQLSLGQQVLRLRKDHHSRLTYKGPADPNQSIAVRKEIEFRVSDFEAARSFLEALGYQVIVHYEKYRTSFSLDDVEIMLDEMPYGTFAEIEGPGTDSVQKAAELLNLRWETSCKESYLMLFDRLKARFGLKARNLSFEEFEGCQFTAADFNLMAADE